MYDRIQCTFRAQYEVPGQLLVPLPFVLVYYSDVAMLDSGNDQTRKEIIVLTQDVFMIRAKFTENCTDGECSSSFIGSLRLTHTTGGLLFRLPEMIVDIITYF